MSETKEQKGSIFLAIPTYDGRLECGSAAGAYAHASRNRPVITAVHAASLLAQCFNGLWCTALNAREMHSVKWFAMLHADIEPYPHWLDHLITELETHDADIVSAVVPIKDDRGLTSTAIDEPGFLWSPKKRLTMQEVAKLPETFTASDAGYPMHALLVNTGCWVCRFDQAWIEDVCFTIKDRVVKKKDGTFRADVAPEDWNFSRWAFARGLRVMATRKVRVNHVGWHRYDSHQVWGNEQDTDCMNRVGETEVDYAAVG